MPQHAPRTSRGVHEVAGNDLGSQERELKALGGRLKLSPKDMNVDNVQNSHGPGNAVCVEVASGCVTEVFTAFGQRGVRAENDWLVKVG